MHIPDGFIDASVSLASGVVAVGGIGYCLKRAGATMDEKIAPMAGLVAAFIFAAQMINFPVALGTSGHLLGGALAVVLVGPYLGPLCVTVVLIVQSLVFADGGLSALGLNIVNMALVTGLVAWTVFRMMLRVLPARDSSVPTAAGIAALVSVPAAAAAFVVEFAFGAQVDLSLTGVAVAMVGVHVLIGIGEAVVTYLTVSAVMATRPDLVYGARGSARPLELRTAGAVG